MRSHSVILMIVLVAVSMANAFEFTSFAEVKELRATRYGNSLIETVSLALQNNGSIASVQKLLDELLGKLVADQKDADEAWAKESKRLLDKIENLKQRIVELKDQLAKKQEELEKYQNLVKAAERNLKQYREQLEHSQNALKELEEKRAKDAADYKQSQSDHTDVINAIDAVVVELSKLIGSVAGKGRYQHIEENATEKRDSGKFLQEKFRKITRDELEANLFVQMATQADQDALKKLIELLVQLKDSTAKSLADDAESERKSIESYNKLKASLSEDIERLGKAIAEQEANLKTYQERVEKLQAEIAALEKLLKETEDELRATEKEYEEKKAQYLAEKAERESEGTVIRRLQGIVKRRLENMSNFLRSNTGA